MAAKIRGLMNEYYDLRGWDRATGRPTRDTLVGLGMGGVADGMTPPTESPGTTHPAESPKEVAP